MAGLDVPVDVIVRLRLCKVSVYSNRRAVAHHHVPSSAPTSLKFMPNTTVRKDWL